MKKNTQPVMVTSYRNPDLDGFACLVGYAEYLRSTGQSAVPKLYGRLHPEARYAVKAFSLHFRNSKLSLRDTRGVILVDASDRRGIDRSIPPGSVLEIIDHRRAHEADEFPQARMQIEYVGAAATLITEKFFRKSMYPSRGVAGILYAAIVSNTLNFKARVTTARDRKMAEWLKQISRPPRGFVSHMFASKSDMTGSKLARAIRQDFAWFTIGRQRVGIAQLEITKGGQLIAGRKKEIQAILKQLQKRENLATAFLTLIDLDSGCNRIVAFDPEYARKLEKVLRIKFVNQVAIRKGFIMRKEIVPELALRKKKNN